MTDCRRYSQKPTTLVAGMGWWNALSGLVGFVKLFWCAKIIHD